MTAPLSGSSFRVIWIALTLIWLAVVPAQARLGPIWTLESTLWPFLLGLLVAYGASAVVLAIVCARSGKAPGSTVALASLPFLSLYLLFLLLIEPTYPRSILLASLPVAGGFLWWSVRAPLRLYALSLVAVGVSGAAAIAVGTREPNTSPLAGARGGERAVLDTAHESLALTHYRDRLGVLGASGGAFALFGERILLVTGDGKFRFLDFDHPGARMEVIEAVTTVPLNQEEFRTAVAGLPEFLPAWFRVNDLLVQDRGGSFRLFASHHFWNDSKRCVVLRISTLEGRYEDFPASEDPGAWNTLFETKPCLPLRTTDPSDPNDHAFAGHFGGGQMALLDEDHLLVAFGDQGFDGVYEPRLLAQDSTASYGKTILINLETGVDSIFTIGHRSPLGLYVTPEGDVWLTENGPEGGDELNRLQAGLNFGWPLATYGTNYGTMDWPLTPEVGRHDGFTPPVYSWLPSIGIASIVRLEEGMFPAWRGDLIVTSLRAQALWRIRTEQGNVTFVERIGIGRRVRDLIEAPDGGILLWQEDEIDGELRGTITTIRSAAEASGELSRGEALWVGCTGCHVSGDAAEAQSAPPLEGMFGRRIAGIEGFNYSSALRSIPGRWGTRNLDRFLENPQAFAPGNMMTYTGISDAGDRAALIQYLMRLE